LLLSRWLLVLAAYYTLSAASIAITDPPDGITRKLPRYPTLPAVRIGRLAVDSKFHGRGLGGSLLADALRIVLVSPPTVFALLVDAKDEQAAAFYLPYGFTILPRQPRTLFLPVATAEKVLLCK
jgi:ribosomal protein S18 acetylase RimI-like enzyme